MGIYSTNNGSIYSTNNGTCLEDFKPTMGYACIFMVIFVMGILNGDI